MNVREHALHNRKYKSLIFSFISNKGLLWFKAFLATKKKRRGRISSDNLSTLLNAALAERRSNNSTT